MRTFLIKSTLLLLCLYFLAFLLQCLIDRGLKKDLKGDYREWNELFNSKINADLLILGSSRAANHFSPSSFDSAFSLNSYNLGMVGFLFHMDYYRFIMYLKHNKKPKYILQSLDNLTLSKKSRLYAYTQFVPYLKDPLIIEAVSTYQGFNWMDRYIPLYKYHSVIDLSVQGIMGNFHQSFSDNGNYKGFQAPTQTWDSSFRAFKKENPNGFRITTDKETHSLFVKFLEFCKVEKIKVLFVYSPEYIEAQNLTLNRDSIINLYRNYAVTYGIPFLDYSKDSICSDTLNFLNSQHLNIIGAKKFNKKLMTDLRGYIK